MATNLSLAEANRQHWDKMASQYESKEWQKVMISYITSQLQARRDIFGISTGTDDKPHAGFRLLDYACGTGVVSRCLGPYVSQILGIDLSASMVQTYNESAEKAGIPREVTHAVQGNLLDEHPHLVGENGEKSDDSFLRDPKFNDFDAVIVSLGFHHFENYARCLKVLSERVKPGSGRVGIADLYPKEGHLAALSKDLYGTMHVSGFTEKQMRGYMEDAGLVDVQFYELPDKVNMEIQDQKTDRTLFFASGRRA